MKKVLFLMFLLLLMGLGAASVKAQVRIGGDTVPNPAAVLDLNATDTTNYGKKGLALPRVSLTSVSTPLSGTPTVNGMVVYNTNANFGSGLYVWQDSLWVALERAQTTTTADTTWVALNTQVLPAGLSVHGVPSFPKGCSQLNVWYSVNVWGEGACVANNRTAGYPTIVTWCSAATNSDVEGHCLRIK